MRKPFTAALVGGAILAAGLTGCSLPGGTGSPAAWSVDPAASVSAPPQAPLDPTATFTVAQRNAIKKAQSYLSHTAFSRSGLISQLEYEQFGAADCEFAVTYLEQNGGVDWMAQAVKKAQSYLSHTAFSKSGLIDQLLYEGFTQAQAQYGADGAYGTE